MDSDGLGQIVGGAIGGLIVMSIIAVVKKGRSEIDERKLSNDPNNIELLRKKVDRDLENSNFESAIETCTRIVSLLPTDLMSNLVLGIYFHNNKEFSKSAQYLKKIYSETNHSAYVEEFKEYPDLVLRGYYYYGHILKLEGENEKAEKVKADLKPNSSKLLREGLF